MYVHTYTVGLELMLNYFITHSTTALYMHTCLQTVENCCCVTISSSLSSLPSFLSSSIISLPLPLPLPSSLSLPLPSPLPSPLPLPLPSPIPSLCPSPPSVPPSAPPLSPPLSLLSAPPSSHQLAEMRIEYQRENEDILDNIRQIAKEVQLQALTMDYFIPQEYQVANSTALIAASLLLMYLRLCK